LVGNGVHGTNHDLQWERLEPLAPNGPDASTLALPPGPLQELPQPFAVGLPSQVLGQVRPQHLFPGIVSRERQSGAVAVHDHGPPHQKIAVGRALEENSQAFPGPMLTGDIAHRLHQSAP